MTDKKKKESKPVPAPKTDLAFDGAEELDDDDVEKAAGGFGRNAIDDGTYDQIQKKLGGNSGNGQGADKELTHDKKKGLVRFM